ncbi:MAG: FAD-dependent oxidoreductase [Sphingobacteriales bacterium]|nr:FAD-dependent oxidoreductase [Sphingobacteriales bacterium]
MTSKKNKVIIVGAGIAGLSVAKLLKQAGLEILIIEASNKIGGRVCTESKNGFLLDKGFQVLLSAYPLAQELLDYESLNLKPFLPGAKILHQQGITEIMDPLRKPSSFFKTLISPAGSLGDKFQMLKLKKSLEKKSIEEIFNEPEQTTDSYLLKLGFSDKMIEWFFRPFLGGIFLERDLITSSRMFNFVFKMFSEGDTVIPEKGMGEIPKQLASCFSEDEIIFNKAVVFVDKGEVKTIDGNSLHADYVVIATDEIHLPSPYKTITRKHREVTNLYFTAFNKPFKDQVIALNANKEALVNNIAVMNNIAKAYSSSGEALISVSILREVSAIATEKLAEMVKKELSIWFEDAKQWQFLERYDISYALPNQNSVSGEPTEQVLKLDERIYRCGDFLTNGSINAAMWSGKKVSQLILKDII